MESKKGLHYGWLIVFSCFMIMSLFLCIVMNCPGLFLISVTEEFGITRSQYTLNTTVISAAMMIISIIFISKLNPRARHIILLYIMGQFLFW